MDKKEYSNGEITIVWKADQCIHAGNCVRGLPNVFKPKENPWIQLESATTEQLIHQVNKCPSGALSFYRNDGEPNEDAPLATRVELIENGPVVIHGPVTIKDKGVETHRNNPRTSICRCGASKNFPYCDGTHKNVT